jgi:chromosome segregation ATPase|nr:MAG: hypothetical protein KatS3mg041_0566 [Bacteroidota bacterium]
MKADYPFSDRPEWKALWERLYALEALIRQLRSERAALEVQVERLRLTVTERDQEILRLRQELARRLESPVDPQRWGQVKGQLQELIRQMDALLAPARARGKKQKPSAGET